MLHSMLTPSDITDPGFYWYFDAIGGQPCVVEVVGEARRDFAVRFTGRADEDALGDLSGSFIGPLLPPLG